jgi:8-oxo-dGTP diphosphatase
LLAHRRILPEVGELTSWRHCPRCGSDLEISDEGAKAECARCDFRHYASSQVTACAIVVDDGKVLLARRGGPPFEGRWDLPGGFVAEGEHPLDAVRRELREEAGLEIEPRELVGIWMDHYSEDESGPSTMNLYFTATSRGGDAKAADDVAELRWTRADDVPPPGELAFHIADVLRVWRDEHT